MEDVGRLHHVTPTRMYHFWANARGPGGVPATIDEATGVVDAISVLRPGAIHAARAPKAPKAPKAPRAPTPCEDQSLQMLPKVAEVSLRWLAISLEVVL